MAELTSVDTLFRPDDPAGVRDAVLGACELDANIVVRGGGTKPDWLAAAPRPDSQRREVTIDTRRLSGLVHHDPGDMTATVLAGTPLDDLRPRLEAAGQRLAVDPPRRGGGPTVGGVVAANDAGPRRFRYGAVRDLVIGTTAVLADGTVSRSGGRVIKNVAGYDLGKLWCGSLGTLGVIAELTVRLHPLPEATRTVRVAANAGQATSFVVDLLASAIECTAVEWSSWHGALLLELEGRAAGLARQVDSLIALARSADLTADDVTGEGSAAGAAGRDDTADTWDAWREGHTGGSDPDATVARASTLPSDLALAVDALAEATRDTPIGTTVHSHAGLGLHDAVLTGGSAADQARVVAGWRARLAQLPGRGGTVVLRSRRAGVDEHVDVWGVLSPRLVALMRDVKSALDPDGRMAPGRFAGGI